MNQFLEKWGDPLVLLLSLVLPIILILIARKKAGKQMRILVAYPFFLGPAILFIASCFHLLQNGAQAVDSISKSTSNYNFRVYALMFMGIVLAHVSFQLLQASMAQCTRAAFKNKTQLIIIAKILLMTLPLIPITNIAVVPAFDCCLNLISLPFVRKNKMAMPVNDLTEIPLAATA